MKKIFLLFVLLIVFEQTNVRADDWLTEIKIDSMVYALNTTQKTATLNCFVTGLTKATIPKSITYNGETYKVNGIRAYKFYHYNGDDRCTTTIDEVEIEDSVNLISPAEAGNLNAVQFFTINKLTIGKGVRLRQAGASSSSDTSPWRGIKIIYCKDDIPLPCTIFTNNGSVPLFPFRDNELVVYVPIGAERTYKYTYGWGNVDQIIGLEELGNVADMQVSVTSFNFSQKSAIVNTHSNFTLPIMLDNKNDVASLEFDVVLPADVTLVGENPFISAGRGSELNISTTDIEDGTVHVVATGELASGKGQIASIELSTTKSDYYNVAFQNVKITTKAGTSITLDNEDLQFVANHKKGDYNEDGDVDIVDAQDLMEYVLNAN